MSRDIVFAVIVENEQKSGSDAGGFPWLVILRKYQGRFWFIYKSRLHSPQKIVTTETSVSR